MTVDAGGEGRGGGVKGGDIDHLVDGDLGDVAAHTGKPMLAFEQRGEIGGDPTQALGLEVEEGVVDGFVDGVGRRGVGGGWAAVATRTDNKQEDGEQPETPGACCGGLCAARCALPCGAITISGGGRRMFC